MNRQSTDDEALYRRFRDGDKAALAQLVVQYQERLKLFIDDFIHDIDEAEGLMMDAFVRLYHSGRLFVGDSSFKTYLFAIGKNLALTYLKRHHKTVSLEESENTAEDEQLPDVAFLRDERNRALYAAMRLLKSEQCEVLHLIYFEKLSYAEAGIVMGKTERAIDGLAYRAKTALRKKLEAGGFNYEDI